MARRLFISISELDQVAIIVGSADETYACGKVVAREACRYDDRWDVN